MNPRRVHELVRKHFPPIEHATREWKLVPDEKDAQLTMLSDLLSTYISVHEVVIEVHRKLGTLICVAEAPSFIASHIGQGEIRIADRAFTSFVVVAINGVATGWHALANNSSQPTAYVGG
ncbi:hypothetical protein CHL79_25980 [Delftia acidovorans]|jgi:hypothetical protein|uniref:hypothetical protein n=1 Tax=Delftia acidovorans TaxID=80866 RepID=UPI000BC3256F|nr:hypothetical protein [Delftia acidovorans]ATH15621.1 hypothetical protein CHL79_25980 [Delftia acidovorans]